MTWSYLPQIAPIKPLYQVRMAIGDTLINDQQLQDEEILQFLAGRTTFYGACADACRSLAAKFSRSVTMKGGGSTANYSDLAKAYLRMATSFENKAVLSGSGMPYAGGISVADKTAQEQNTDRVKPQFNIDSNDNNLVPGGPAPGQTQSDAALVGG